MCVYIYILYIVGAFIVFQELSRMVGMCKHRLKTIQTPQSTWHLPNVCQFPDPWWMRQLHGRRLWWPSCRWWKKTCNANWRPPRNSPGPGSRVEDLWKAKKMFFCNFFGCFWGGEVEKNNWSFVTDNWKIANYDVWRGWWILYSVCGIQFIRAIGRSIFYIHVAKYFTTWNPPEFPQPVIYLVSPSSLYFHPYQERFPKD